MSSNPLAPNIGRAADLSTKSWSTPPFRVDFVTLRQSKYAVVVPVLNEADRISRQLERMSLLMRIVDVHVVDGGSTDGSIKVPDFRNLGVRAILTKQGSGRLSAQLRIGLSFALQEGYEGVILIDGNDKDKVTAITRFVTELDNGGDHIQGSRFLPEGKHENTPWLRLAAIRLLHAPLISLASRFRYTDSTNGFRAYSRRFLLDPRVSPFRDVFDSYELHSYLQIRAARLGYHVKEIPVERCYPKSGPIPTKIRSFGGHWEMFSILMKACLGRYNP